MTEAAESPNKYLLAITWKAQKEDRKFPYFLISPYSIVIKEDGSIHRVTNFYLRATPCYGVVHGEANTCNRVFYQLDQLPEDVSAIFVYFDVLASKKKLADLEQGKIVIYSNKEQKNIYERDLKKDEGNNLLLGVWQKNKTSWEFQPIEENIASYHSSFDLKLLRSYQRMQVSRMFFGIPVFAAVAGVVIFLINDEPTLKEPLSFILLLLGASIAWRILATLKDAFIYGLHVFRNNGIYHKKRKEVGDIVLAHSCQTTNKSDVPSSEKE